ncbi:WD40 repeat domain-containing protein [Kitasatospora sp. NPDC057223]|uniref:WD40 repeat domain-containing protein n=1 Tax=Kitasatospora sp. NPDC057223 TaxID=3346055 RepID=UPI00362F2E5D
MAALAIAPDGSWLAAGGSGGTVAVWDLRSGEHLATLTGHTEWVSALAVSPDGAWLASTSNDRTVRVWNIAARETATMMRTDNSLNCCRWSSDGTAPGVGGSAGLYSFRFHPGTA